MINVKYVSKHWIIFKQIKLKKSLIHLYQTLTMLRGQVKILPLTHVTLMKSASYVSLDNCKIDEIVKIVIYVSLTNFYNVEWPNRYLALSGSQSRKSDDIGNQYVLLDHFKIDQIEVIVNTSLTSTIMCREDRTSFRIWQIVTGI